MILFDCPGCGNSYELNGETLPVGSKMYCSSCGKKLINLEDGLAVIAYEISENGMEHDIACPHCYSQYGFAKDCSGLFGCAVCGKNFYVCQDLPSLPEGIVYEEDEVPVEEVPAPEYSAPVEEVPAPEQTGGNPLLNFQNEAKSLITEVSGSVFNPGLKVGVKREKSGIMGKFISIAEKLCKN